MNIAPNKMSVIAAIIGLAGLAGLMLAHAQETGTSGTTTRKNAEAISPELAAELKAVEQLPTVEPSTLPYDGRGGTFYSAQCPFWPPLPDNIFSLPVWNLGDGYYLINDLSVDYAAMDTNSIPLWEAADPNNPGTGILTVFIDSPTNGAVLQ